jgi:hypothetical protein
MWAVCELDALTQVHRIMLNSRRKALLGSSARIDPTVLDLFS